MGRDPCCSKAGLNRRTWSKEEDKLLTNFIQTHGEGQWRDLPSKAGLMRCRKSCRLRWMNYLRPGIKKGRFTSDENDIIIRLQSIHGNRWSLIANELPGRTDHQIKNHWNLHLRHKVHDGKGENEPNDSKENKKTKKNRRKTDPKSKKLKTVEKPEEVVPENTSSSSTSTSTSSSSSSSFSQSQSQLISLSLRKDQGFDNGLTSGISDMDELLDKLLTTDVSWPNWSPLYVMEGSASNMDELLDMPMDDLDSTMKNHDENEMLQKLYDEYMHLL